MKKDQDLLELLLQKLRWLRLPGMAGAVEELLELAAKKNLSTLAVLDRLCDEEKESRMRSAVQRRVREARFPEINTVDAFDFNFDPVRKKLRSRYLALHDLSFLETGINPLFIGTPGAGKTFLARALAYRACQSARRVVIVNAPRMLNDLHGAEIHGGLDRALRRYVRAEFLMIDDFAVLAIPRSGQARFSGHLRALRVPPVHMHHHESTLQGLAESLPRRSQRSGHRRAAHRACRALRAREGLPPSSTDNSSLLTEPQLRQHVQSTTHGDQRLSQQRPATTPPPRSAPAR